MTRMVRWFLIFVIIGSVIPVRVAALDEPPVVINPPIAQAPVDVPIDVMNVAPLSSLSPSQAEVTQLVRTGMMISYVQTYGDKDASNEVVTITNTSATRIDVTN